MRNSLVWRITRRITNALCAQVRLTGKHLPQGPLTSLLDPSPQWSAGNGPVVSWGE